MFEAKRRNSAAVQHYSLNVPSSGSFLYVNVELSKSIIRTKDAFVKLTFKRENVFNLTDSEVLQTFQVNGNGSFVKKIKVRKANVSAPDPSNSCTTHTLTPKASRSAVKSGFICTAKSRRCSRPSKMIVLLVPPSHKMQK